MLGIKRVAAGLLVGGSAMYFADHYHLLHTTEGLVVVPRAQQASLRTAYADVRGWDATKWTQYPELTESLSKDGRGGLLLSNTVDGLMQQAGEAIGVSPRATATSVTPPDRPPIVFDSPVGASQPGGTASPARGMESAAEDSLLERLSRQLQSHPTAGDVPPRQSQFTPAAAPSANVPGMPATAREPSPAQGRANLPVEQLPEDLYPSIHSAGLQRSSSATIPALETGGRSRVEVRPSQSTDGTVTERLREAAAVVLNRQEGFAAPPAAASMLPPGSAGEADLIPLDIDGGQLRDRLPPAMQDTMQLFTPLLEPSAQRPTVSAF